MNPIAIHTLSVVHPVWLQWYFEAPSRESPQVPINIVMYVRLPVCISAAITGRISLKFDFGDVNENLSRKIQIWLKSDKGIGHFTWRSECVSYCWKGYM